MSEQGAPPAAPPASGQQAPAEGRELEEATLDPKERQSRDERRNGRIVNYRVFLSVLPEDTTGPREQIDCGPVCQIPEEV